MSGTGALPMAQTVTHGGDETPTFAACPVCHQYSHSIRGDKLGEAFNHFHMMFSHRGDGIPTQHVFDEKTRDAAQVLLAVANGEPSKEPLPLLHFHEAQAVGVRLRAECPSLPNDPFKLADLVQRTIRLARDQVEMRPAERDVA